MTKKMYFLSIGLVTISLLVVGCDKEAPTGGKPTQESPLGREDATQATPTPKIISPSAQAAQPISQVSPATLTGTGLITFEDVPGDAASPGANFDGVLTSGGAPFAERLAGQTLSLSGNFDVLSGTPTSPLTLQVGAPGRNLDVLLFGGSNVLAGLGPTGFPLFSAIGEGAFAVLFNSDQFELGFDIVGAGGGSATVNFFRRDGSLIQTLVLTGLLGSQSFAFRRAGSVRDIAGLSIHNNDGCGFRLRQLQARGRGRMPGGRNTIEPG